MYLTSSSVATFSRCEFLYNTVYVSDVFLTRARHRHGPINGALSAGSSPRNLRPRTQSFGRANVTFVSRAQYDGGALYLTSSSATFSQCEFLHNTGVSDVCFSRARASAKVP